MKTISKNGESRAEATALPLSFPDANLIEAQQKSKCPRKKTSTHGDNPDTATNLDYYRNKCNRYEHRARSCKRGGIVLSLNERKNKWQEFGAFRIRCKTLICEKCSKQRRARIASHIRYFLQMFPNTHMLTLTLRAGKHSTGVITKYWLLLRARLWKAGIKFKFFAVRELTKAGTEHLHILVSQRLNIALIRKIWHEITGDSFVVHIKKADEGAVQYLSKYLSKNQKHWRIIILKRMRLYSYSKGLTLGQHARLRIGSFVQICDSFEEAIKKAEELNWESYLEYAAITDASPPQCCGDPLPF